MTLLQLATRNVLRNARRSALTAITVLLGCALLTIGLSWVTGIHGSFIDAGVRANGHVRLVSDAYAQREQLAPLYENIPDTAELIVQLSEVEDVEHAFPRIQMGVAASVGGDEIGEVFGLLVGAPTEYYDQILDLRPRVIEGTFFTEDGAAEEALIGRSLAANMEAKVGDEAIFLGQTQDGSISPIKVTVAGIVDTGNGLFDKQVYVSLEKARWMADIPDGSVEILVFGADSDISTTLVQRIEPMLAQLAETGGVLDIDGNQGTLSMSAWDTRAPFSTIIATARIIIGIISTIIVFITALGVLNTMLMSVLERTAEIGVLRALGMKVWGVVLMFVLEAITISAIGGFVGTVIGSVVSILMEAHGVDLGGAASNLPDTIPTNRILYPDWSWDLAGASFALGIIMAFIGSASPALRAARVQPVTAMRNRR